LYKVGRLDVLEAVADKATAYFASLSPGDLGDTTQFSRARALRLLGGVRVSQSRFADALAAFSGAYERAADLTARHPKDPEALFERGQAEFGIGLVHWRRAEYSEAGDWLTRYRDTCAALVDLEPARQDRQRDLLDGQHNLAALREERGELAAAQSEFLAELASLEKMGASDPADLDLRIRQADTNAELGSIAEQRGDLAESLKRYSAQEAHLEYVTLADPKTETWRQSQAKALLLEESIDLVIGQYSAAGELLAKAQKLLEAQVARDPANLDWKGVFLYARMAEAVLSRRQGDVAAATRYVDEVLPQFEAIAASEPTDHVIAMMVLKAWRLKAQLQAADGRADATNSALQAVGIGERLSRAGGLTDGEIGECARAYVVAGDIAARNGDDGGARRDYLRAAELVAPLLAATSYWQVLDPAARSAAALGRSAEARAAIEKLNLLGYVPVDPWPELERPGAAKISEQQPK
jgi:tetratricopeptide (TPR) repeat protein